MKALSDKAQATRERILRAANELFYLHGYTATGLERIIAAAGVTKGNFYYHFKSKEELAVAVIDWHREQAAREIGIERILAAHSPVAAVLALVESIAQRLTCTPDARIRGCFFGNFALELATGNEAVRRKVQEFFSATRALLRSLLERAKAAGEVRADLDCDAAAGLVLSLMEGAVLLDKAAQERREIDNALAFLKWYLAPPA